MLHFAPRYGMISPCLHWGPARSQAVRLPRPTNDNGAALAHVTQSANDTEAHEEALLAAALRLFAAHGLSAAQRACEAADIASAGGDSAAAEWWITVCAMLDGPLARACQARAVPQR